MKQIIAKQITTTNTAERRAESQAAAVAARRAEQLRIATIHVKRALRADARTGHAAAAAQAVGVCAC
jgi:hypothetical protein